MEKLESKLDLTIKPLDDIEREFHLLINQLKKAETNSEDMDAKQKAHFNQDLNGWVNWINSIRKP